MSQKIKEAFALVKKDISGINKRIQKTDSNKIILEQELTTIKQRLIIEGELQVELNNLLQKYSEMKVIKEDLEDQMSALEDVHTKEVYSLNKRIDEHENQVQEGLSLLSSSIKETLSRVEMQTKNEEKRLKEELALKIEREAEKEAEKKKIQLQLASQRRKISQQIKAAQVKAANKAANEQLKARTAAKAKAKTPRNNFFTKIVNKLSDE